MGRMGKFLRRFEAAVAGGALALAAGVAGSSPALAACNPAAADGVTATCSGVTNNQGGGAPGTNGGMDGYGTGTENNVTVNVLPGATVTGTNFGLSLGNNITVGNSGSIAGNFRGIQAGTITSLNNSGFITGTQTAGISAATIGSLSNSGSITGSIVGVNAVTITSLSNSGSITGSIAGVNAVTITSLSNSGSITGGNGIVAATITSLTNSGLISGGNFAIWETAAADTQLTLLAGSVLVGQVDLGGGVNTLNVGKGLSMATTFMTAPVIGSMGVPFVVNGTQVVTADTTSLANHATSFADLAGGIFSTVENRLDHLRGGVSSFAQPMYMAHAADASASGPWAGFGAGGASVDRSRQVWMQAFGSFRQQEGTSTTLDSQHRIGGFVSGMDAGTASGRAGLFIGGAAGASVIDAQAGKTTQDSFFGGAYTSTQVGRGFVDLAFIAGYSSFDRERRIANNFVPGGIETAKADYHGWFVSPEVRFTRPLPLGALPLEASLTLRYAGLFLDGFAESGVTAGAMTVDGKDIHLGIARAALSLPLTRSYSDGAVARWVLTGGVEGRTQFGGESFSGTLQGQSIAFSAGGRDTVGLYGAWRAELASPLGHTVFAAVEGLAEQDGSYQLSGKAGFRVQY
jgi:hypothetical protein